MKIAPKRDEVTWEWRKLHNYMLNLYTPPCMIQVIKLRRVRWAGHVASMGERRGTCRVLVGKPVGKRPLGRLRHSWKVNIKMDFQEVEWGGMDWIVVAQNRDMCWALVNAIMNLWVP